jgi:hypothetical protein
MVNLSTVRGFGSRDQNWGPCKYYAEKNLRTLLYGSRALCGTVAWHVLITVPILVKDNSFLYYS